MGQFMLGTSEQTAKISETGFAQFGHTTVSKPQWAGFSSKKTGCDKFESWENFTFISLLGLFSPERPIFFFRYLNFCPDILGHIRK